VSNGQECTITRARRARSETVGATPADEATRVCGARACGYGGVLSAPNHYLRWMERPDAPRGKLTSRLGTIALVVTLLGLLAASVLFAVRSFTSLEGPPMPRVGYVAMMLGVLFSLVIGIPLMALLFVVTAMTRGCPATLCPMTTASRNSRGATRNFNRACAGTRCARLRTLNHS
jgi:hypothetical protein